MARQTHTSLLPLSDCLWLSACTLHLCTSASLLALAARLHALLEAGRRTLRPATARKALEGFHLDSSGVSASNFARHMYATTSKHPLWAASVGRRRLSPQTHHAITSIGGRSSPLGRSLAEKLSGSHGPASREAFQGCWATCRMHQRQLPRPSKTILSSSSAQYASISLMIQ